MIFNLIIEIVSCINCIKFDFSRYLRHFVNGFYQIGMEYTVYSTMVYWFVVVSGMLWYDMVLYGIMVWFDICRVVPCNMYAML